MLDASKAVSFGFPEFYLTASLDVLLKVFLVVTKLGFTQHFSKSKALSTKMNAVKLKSRMSKIANMIYYMASSASGQDESNPAL